MPHLKAVFPTFEALSGKPEKTNTMFYLNLTDPPGGSSHPRCVSKSGRKQSSSSAYPIMHKSYFSFLAFVSCLIPSAQAQLYPTLSGQSLLEQLVFDFKPTNVLDYDEARDTLYSKIFNDNGSVSCVYSGFSLPLYPDQDPSTALFMNGSANGINCEHTFPRSKGADVGNPKSDMHHLFPARAGVNTARGNDPYADVPDLQTVKWFRLDEELTSVPTSMIDEYSERGNGTFEPREDHKGNVARAMFYFYTMYRQQADAADPAFFELQRETLCQWHYDDPIDSLESARTLSIAAYQDGLANPFVLDCTIASRTYCSDNPQPCTPLVASREVPAPEQPARVVLTLSPQPANLFFRLQASSDDLSEAVVRILALDGTLLQQVSWNPDSPIDCSQLPPGLFLVFLQSADDISLPVKLLIAR